MKTRVVNRFKELLTIKERSRERAGKRYTIRELSQILGMAETSVSFWLNNTVTRFDADKIVEICKFLGCEVGDLLVIEEEADEAEDILGNMVEALPA